VQRIVEVREVKREKERRKNDGGKRRLIREEWGILGWL